MTDPTGMAGTISDLVAKYGPMDGPKAPQTRTLEFRYGEDSSGVAYVGAEGDQPGSGGVSEDAEVGVGAVGESEKGDPHSITWFGDKRGFLDGPKYGNWGGKSWSGGQNPNKHGGSMGTKPPVDSSDEIYKSHDECYDKESNGSKEDIDRCDDSMINRLEKLPSDSRQWENPPKLGTEPYADDYRWRAIMWFKDWLK